LATPFIPEVKEFLGDAGYRPSDMVEGYRYTVCTPDGNLKSATAPLVAFGSPQRNMRSACVAAFEAPSDSEAQAALREVRYLATPAAIVGLGQGVSFYAVSHQGEPSVVDTYPREEWRRRLRHRLEYLDPRSLMAAKRGVREIALFDARLFSWAEDITERTLSSLLEEMFDTLNRALGAAQRKTRAVQQSILHFLFRMLAARVLEDQAKIERALGPWDTARAASTFLGIKLDPAIAASVPDDAAARILKAMRERFSFDSLTPETLAYAYENALVSNQARHDLGIFYTPRSIARYVLQHLPLESLPQAKRVLLDPCCGSGSFLLAAHERLNAMLPDEWGPAQRHKYLADRLLGMDVDPFARETARLALLLAGLEVGNGWTIIDGDATKPLPAALPRTPMIVVTNPPFKEVKGGGVRRELAAEIIANLLSHLPPDGFIGVVVPQSLLESSAAKAVRATLLRTCTVMEIATFPGSLFHSNAETAVLLARKDSGSRSRRASSVVTIRECHAKDVAAFQRSQKFSATYSVSTTAWDRDDQARFIASPFFDLWERLEKSCKTLEEVALVENGLQVRPDDSESVSKILRVDDVPYVDRVSTAIVPFAFIADGTIEQPKYLRYGQQLHRTRSADNFEDPKVLISSNRNPAYSWRIIAAIAPAGIYYSENFQGIRPRDDKTTLHELVAVLNCHVANAWFHSHCRKRKIVLRILKQMPFPTFDVDQRERLGAKVRRLSSLAHRARANRFSWLTEGAGLWDSDLYTPRVEALREEATLVLGEIDAIVFDAYGISESERQALTKWMGLDRRPTPV